MKVKRTRCGVVAALTLLVALSVFVPVRQAQAQQIPSPVLLDVPLVRQETPVWCWLAVSEMVIRYRNAGTSLRQCEMMEIGYGLPSGTCCGNPSACMRAASGMHEVQLVLARFGGVTSQITPPLPAPALYGALQRGSPVVVQIRSGMASSHVIVIRGMRFVPQMAMTPYGPMMVGVQPILLVNDPLSFLPSEVPYERVLPIWIDSLIVNP